jgi:hypothetical protein
MDAGVRFRKIVVVLAATVVLALSGCGGSSLNQEAHSSGFSLSVRPRVVCPFGPQRTTQSFRAHQLVGLDVSEARGLAREHDCSVRVVKRDGKSLSTTLELDYRRVDVAVEDHRVVAVEDVG